jgi:outer membrane protein assembly factor BamA
MKLFILSSVLLIYLTSVPSRGQTESPTDSTKANFVQRIASRFDSTHQKDGGFVPIPLLYYTPDTRLAYGVAGAYYFKIKNKETNTSTRLSYIAGLVDYTQNRQLDVWSYWYVFLRDERWILKGELRYRNFPDRFYGIGNNTPETNMERYEYNLISIKKLVMRKLAPNIYLGGDYNFSYLFNFNIDQAPQLSEGAITGSRGGRNSGLGVVFLMDTRDNVANATKGQFLEISSYFYGKALGGQFSYTNFMLTYNRYHRLPWGNNHFLCTNSSLNFNFGDPPFVFLAQAGNEDILRGYARNRFRDMRFIGTQVEYRLPLFWRLGAVGFAGVGEVFDGLSDLRWNRLKYSYGAGLRLAVNRRERVNIRVDYGFGRDNTGFYLGIMEAF